MLQVNVLETTNTQLEPWSYSRLTDLNTCEVWGMVRGAYRKTFPTSGRSMALEAGSAAHEAFAAFRLYNLLANGLDDHFAFHTRRVFGQEKGAALVAKVRKSSDEHLNMMSFAIDALHMSGFYDDPMDKRRTMSNIEEALYAYGRSVAFKQNPVWVQDKSNPECLVGIELPFDFTLEMTYRDDIGTVKGLHTVRYIGTIDAVHINKKGQPYIEENKTASRLGDAWAASFETSHQVTGYTVFASKLLGIPISEALIHGVSLPQPRKATTYTEGVRSEYVSRSEDQQQKFFQWVYNTYMKRVRIGDDIELATQETHSCNRYFQACSLIPFCNSGGAEERQAMLDEMTTLELSPSEQAVMEKTGD